MQAVIVVRNDKRQRGALPGRLLSGGGHASGRGPCPRPDGEWVGQAGTPVVPSRLDVSQDMEEILLAVQGVVIGARAGRNGLGGGLVAGEFNLQHALAPGGGRQTALQLVHPGRLMSPSRRYVAPWAPDDWRPASSRARSGATAPKVSSGISRRKWWIGSQTMVPASCRAAIRTSGVRSRKSRAELPGDT